MPSCCVPWCQNRPERNRNLSFYRFPSDKEEKRKWLNFISQSESRSTRRQKFSPNRNSRVCSWHFPEGKAAGPLRFKWSKEAPPDHLSSPPEEREEMAPTSGIHHVENRVHRKIAKWIQQKNGRFTRETEAMSMPVPGDDTEEAPSADVVMRDHGYVCRPSPGPVCPSSPGIHHEENRVHGKIAKWIQQKNGRFTRETEGMNVVQFDDDLKPFIVVELD